MGPHAEADYNLTLCPLQSRLPVPTHEPWALIGQLYASVDLNPVPESIYPLVRNLGFGLSQLEYSWAEYEKG
jgi:hypothetical protein